MGTPWKWGHGLNRILAFRERRGPFQSYDHPMILNQATAVSWDGQSDYKHALCDLETGSLCNGQNGRRCPPRDVTAVFNWFLEC